MDINSTEVLEWQGVLDEIKKITTSNLGKQICQELPFADSFEEAVKLQQQTSEALYLLDETGKIPLNGLRDVRSSLLSIDKGGIIQGEEFLDIASTLRAIRVLKKYIIKHLEETAVLYELVFPLYTNQDYENKIEATFASDGSVLDTASQKLLKIRTSIKNIQNNIKEKLLRILQEPRNKNIVQENLITQRNNRYVIPVKAESQGHIKGIVQDQSLSGATVFLEPMVVVEDNNSLTGKMVAEQAEIQRILRELGEEIIADLEVFLASLTQMANIDVIIARAKYCKIIEAKKVHLNNNGLVDLYKIKHPLLIIRQKQGTVPIDLHLGRSFDTLIITGSNTGGKTVSLKTLGLCALMVKFGLYLPTRTEADMAYFDKVLADIGDEQSLEQNLSTFSGHLTHINQIIKASNANSLVLLDEIGTGTDPSEGAAIAQAIIEALRKKQGKIVVTTHFGELKLMAYQTKGISNASVEFDLGTLSPTYKLLIGVPGKSNALHIARRLGLAPEIVERATALLSNEERDITSSINKMENEYLRLSREREEQEAVSRQLQAKESEYEQKLEKLQSKQKEKQFKRYDHFTHEVRKALAEVKKIVRELQKSPDSQGAEAARQHISQISARLEKKHDKQLQQKEIESPNNIQLEVGEFYYLEKLRQLVQILNLNKNQEAEVQAGNLKLTVPQADLQEISGKELQQQVKNLRRNNKIEGKIKVKRSSANDYRNTFNECDLRGLYVEDALLKAEHFLDESILSNISPIYIIHGIGTGALRQAIRDYLKNYPHVDKFRAGEQFEGGEGITVIYLKN